jgi:phage shock protein A
MGIFSRFTDIINANLNSLLDKAEQPEKMIKLIIQEMEECTVELRLTAAKYIAEEKVLARQITQHKVDVDEWQEKAELALTKNREDLAKSALQQKHKSVRQLNELTQHQAIIGEQLSILREDGQSLQNKLSQAKSKQQAFITRQQSLDARLKGRKKVEQYNAQATIHKFECYQQKIEKVESQIEAYDLLQNTELACQLDTLKADHDIEQELNELKRQQKLANVS